MRKPYHKLVRDRIPEIIRQSGEECEMVTLAEPDYQQALRQKLVEEAEEAARASEEELITELADLFEVMDALMGTYGISEEAVRQVQAQRQAERGGFTQRLLLRWTDTSPSR